MGRETRASLHLFSILKGARNRLRDKDVRHLHGIRDPCAHSTHSCTIDPSHELPGKFLLDQIHNGRYLRALASVATDVDRGNLLVNQASMHADVGNGSWLLVNRIGATSEHAKDDPTLQQETANGPCLSIERARDNAAFQQERSDGSCLSVMRGLGLSDMHKVTHSLCGGDIVFESEGSDEEDALAVDKDDSIEMDITLFGQMGKSETAISMYQILNGARWSSPDTEEKLSSVARRVSPELVIEVIKLLRNSHIAHSFLNWAKDQEGYEPRAEAYTHVIARFGRERDFNSAWQLLLEMKGCKLPIDFTFSIFLHRLKRARRVQGVVKAMCGMAFLGVAPTVALYTSALEFILKLGVGDDATHLYKQMLQDALVPDKKLYEVLIVGFIKIGRLDDVLFLFNDMKNRGYMPHVSVYSALVSSMAVAQMLDKGHELYEEMLGTAGAPKVFGVNEIACALHGKDTMKMIKRFLKVVERAPYKWKIQSHNNLIQCLLDYGRYNEAKEIFKKIPCDGEAQANSHKDFINYYWNLNSYKIYIIGMCKLNQFSYAMEVFKELVERRLKPTNEISSFLLLSLSNAKMIDEALAFSKQHITGAREPVSIDAQSSFFSALRTSGHLSVALKIFSSMKRKGCIDQDADFVSLIGLENKDDVLSLMAS